MSLAALLLATASLGVASGGTGDPGTEAVITGRVSDAGGEPARGISVLLDGPGTARRVAVVDTPDGTFAFDRVAAPGRYRVVLLDRGGAAGDAVEVEVEPGATRTVSLVLPFSFLEEVTVTDSREAVQRRESPASIGTVGRDELALAPPSHPGEVLGRVAGVWVSQTSGEGHQTAIRQPLTTSPVYLFLEDGVPTRSTGFFNHNALYEVNVAQAESVEVTRGPGSALYGSDALAGVVNVLTRSPFSAPGLGGSVEVGSFGWRRALASARLAGQRSGLGVDVNVTSSDGFRDATSYRRRSVTARFDTALSSGWYLKTVAAFSDVDQETAGASVLPRNAYEHRPELNLTPISFRTVRAFRLSSEYSLERGATLWSVIPYVRSNRMEILPNWSLSYDPTVYTTESRSLGVLAKVRRAFGPGRTELLAGLDLDYSPGSRVEDAIVPTTTTLPGGPTAFTGYRAGARVYDYDVTYSGAAPYLQLESSLTSRLRVTAGLRYDLASYDHDDRLETPATPRHRRPGSTSLSYRHLSPKLGATLEVSRSAVLYASYRHAFRVPSESQLFRQGSAADTVGLEPVRADSVELGLRLSPAPGLDVEVVAYRLAKRDDILSYRDPLDGSTTAVNAGRTRHEGVELQARARLLPWARLDVAWSLARHVYLDWSVDPAAGTVYSGKEMEGAPRHLGTASLTLTPAPWHDATVTVEWTHLGPYYMDAANTHRYEGHDTLGLRASAPLGHGLRAWLQVRNLTDRRLAEAASYTVRRGEELSPGAPRTVVAGLELSWGR